MTWLRVHDKGVYPVTTSHDTREDGVVKISTVPLLRQVHVEERDLVFEVCRLTPDGTQVLPGIDRVSSTGGRRRLTHLFVAEVDDCQSAREVVPQSRLTSGHGFSSDVPQTRMGNYPGALTE